MSFEEVRGRLLVLLRRLARQQRWAGVLGMMVAALVLALTFGLTWITILVATLIWGFRLRDTTLSWLSLGFVVLLFLSYRRARPPALEEIEFTESEEQGLAWMGPGARVSPFAGLLGMAMAPRAVGSMARLVADVLFAGPRLVDASLTAFRQAGRLKSLDVDGIAAVLTVLLAHPGRVAFDEIVARIEGLDAERVFAQMKAIPGVVILPSPPPGLSLTPDLRAQLRGG
jgi:hypothetical protein